MPPAKESVMSENHPLFYGVTRTFEDNRVDDVAAETRRRITALLPENDGRLSGKSVAVCVGSRGIASLPELVKGTINALRQRGANPFIVPAMGSHGGATAGGQIEMLASLGVTGASAGAPIVSSMDVTDLEAIPGGPTVRFSTDALKADYVVPVVRVKQHTALTGDVQSGLCKMIVIGCGKHKGAEDYHRHDISRVLVQSAEITLKHVPLLFGVAVVENACEHVCEIRVVKPEEFIETDKELLRLARTYLPRVPIPQLDALLINEIGKDISGGGADVNVIGTWRRDGGERIPDYNVHAVLGFTEATHGNAIGLGHMDIMPKRLLDQINYKAMFINVITAVSPRSARTPLWVEDDRAILDTILGWMPDPSLAAVARIMNTRDLGRFWVTKAAIERITPNTGCVVDTDGQQPRFDKEGRLLPFE